MKTEWIRMARVNGQQAKVNARRMVLVINLYQSGGNYWLRNEAARLAKKVDFYLRQAHLIGQYIEKLEQIERQAIKLESELDILTRPTLLQSWHGKV